MQFENTMKDGNFEKTWVDSFELYWILWLGVALMFEVSNIVSRMSRLVLKGLSYVTSTNIEDWFHAGFTDLLTY